MHKFSPSGADSATYVTRPSLPPLDDFLPYLREIWDSGILTNNGPFHQRLEKELESYLGVPYISLFANCTIALITALQALRVTGEVITTPYSFVATAHSVLWNGLRPVFVDIDPETFNLDPEKIEAAITPQTTAILPVHCYGRSCNTEKIKKIADIYGLKIIYDAAHAFGVNDGGGSILRHGDLSVLSFHATKVFTTFEGGAIVSPDLKTKNRIDYLKNFGFSDEVTVVAPGINGKMSEFNAALGLLQLGRVESDVARRCAIAQRYCAGLKDIPGIELPGIAENGSYFPILIKENYPVMRDDLYDYLRRHGIHARRYFYPLISSFPMYRGMPSAASQNLPAATQAASRILCLPIYPDLADAKVDYVVSLLREVA